ERALYRALARARGGDRPIATADAWTENADAVRAFWAIGELMARQPCSRTLRLPEGWRSERTFADWIPAGDGRPDRLQVISRGSAGLVERGPDARAVVGGFRVAGGGAVVGRSIGLRDRRRTVIADPDQGKLTLWSRDTHRPLATIDCDVQAVAGANGAIVLAP